MSDDFFYSPPAGGQPPQQPGFQQPQPAPSPPPSGPQAGMPGYSWAQQEQVRSPFADAPPAIPMSSATIVAGVAALGSVVMMVASWGPWVKLSIPFFNQTESVGGLHSGVDGKWILAFGFAALLAAGSALTTGQSNLQVRRICAGALVALGAIGLGIVIHEWVTVSGRFREANEYLTAITNSFAGSGSLPPGSASTFADLANGFHISKGWGLTLSGLSSAVTGLAGAYLFVVR